MRALLLLVIALVGCTEETGGCQTVLVGCSDDGDR